MLSSCTPSTQQDTIYINFKRQAARLDPAFASNQANIRVSSNVFETLVNLNEQLELEPNIAHDIQVSASGLEYTVRLDTNKRF